MPQQTVEIRFEGNFLSVSGRLGTIFAWLLRNRERVERIGHGELNFAMAGRKVRPKIVEFEPEMEA